MAEIGLAGDTLYNNPMQKPPAVRRKIHTVTSHLSDLPAPAPA